MLGLLGSKVDAGTSSIREVALLEWLCWISSAKFWQIWGSLRPKFWICLWISQFSKHKNSPKFLFKASSYNAISKIVWTKPPKFDLSLLKLLSTDPNGPLTSKTIGVGLRLPILAPRLPTSTHKKRSSNGQNFANTEKELDNNTQYVEYIKKI